MNDSERSLLTEAEKLARQAVGIEGEAKHFIINGETADKTLQREVKYRFNNRVNELTEKMNAHENLLKEYADKVQDSLGDLEIKAINNYMITKPFAENPFQKIRIDERTGIITDTGGFTPQYFSNETGQWEEEKQNFEVAMVVDAGPECKWIEEGDVVIYPIISSTPIPFYKQGFKWINETRIMAVVANGLTERFNNKK